MIYFLILSLFLLVNPLLGKPLSGTYELTFDVENRILRGKAIFELEREGFYEFSLSDIKITDLLYENASSKFIVSQEGKSFKLFNNKKNAKLTIHFEREFALKPALGYQIIESYLPYPLEKSYYEILIKFPADENLSLLVPAEEDFIREDGLLAFKIGKPLREPPPLLIGAFIRREIEIDGFAFIFLLPKRSKLEERDWRAFESSLRQGITRFPEPLFLTPFNRIFFLSSEEIKIYPFIISMPLPLKDADLPREVLKNTTKHTLKYALNLKESSLWYDLTPLFVEYNLSPNKREYRRILLLNTPKGSESFFFFYERFGQEKEREFFNFLFSQLRKNFFTDIKDTHLLSVLRERFGIDQTFGFNKDLFCKIMLKPFTELRKLDDQRGYHLRIKFNVESCFRPISLKIVTLGETQSKEQRLLLDRPEKIFELYLSEKPQFILVDRDYEIFRKVTFLERDFHLNSFLQGKGVIYLSNQEVYPIYKDFVHLLRDRGYQFENVLPEVRNLPPGNVIILDSPPKGFHLALPKEGFYYKSLPHPKDPEASLVILKASSLREFKEAWQRREQWRTAEEVFIKGGRVISKIERKPQDGIKIDLTEEKIISGVRTVELIDTNDLILELLPFQVILIGENHDQYSHHHFQLQVIKGIRRYTKDLVIALEMVQVPFQRYLDEFVEGKITERELLDKIEYFDRWRFDWRLYREIFLFAREHRIKLLAIDTPQEIVRKIFRSGLDSLSLDEKKYLPELDLHNPSYEHYLRKSFERHPFNHNASFEYFYQAQAVRDEAMAERILDYLRRNPEKKVIVLAGKGHMLYGHGIPHALKRRNFSHFKTIILGEVEEINPTIGDYWFSLPSLSFNRTPQLGVLLEEDIQGLRIKEVFENSSALRAGLKSGDIILKLDGSPLKKINDVKILLSLTDKREIFLEILREGRIEKIKIDFK